MWNFLDLTAHVSLARQDREVGSDEKQLNSQPNTLVITHANFQLGCKGVPNYCS